MQRAGSVKLQPPLIRSKGIARCYSTEKLATSQRFHSIQQVLKCQRTLGWKKAISGRLSQTIQDQLPVIRCRKTLIAGNMPRDQPIGVHLLEESSHIGGGRVPAPDKGMNLTAGDEAPGMQIVACQNGQV